MQTLSKLFLSLCISMFISLSFAQNKFDIGLQAGIFVPSNWLIQGYQSVNYVDGSPTNITLSGFGNGNILNLYAKYYFSEHTGIMVEGGANLLYENKLDLALAPSGEHDVYENKLTIFPVNLCLIHRLKFADTKISPFTGAGFGIYFSEWEQKHFPENNNRTWLKGKENPVGIKFFTGFDFPVYHDLILNFQLDYNYAATDWTITNVDSNNETVYKKLNIGGISFKFGLGFRF